MEAILEAAVDEFVQYGFEGSRTKRIAEKAGVAEGTIYNHVSSKSELFEAVIVKTVEDHLEQVELIEINVDNDPAQALRNLIKSAYGNLVSGESMEIMRLVLAETHRFPDLAEFYREEIMEQSRSLMADILDAGGDQGVFRREDFDRFPEILAGPITTLIFNLLLEPDRQVSDDELDEYLEMHLDVMLNGILEDNQ